MYLSRAWLGLVPLMSLFALGSSSLLAAEEGRILKVAPVTRHAENWNYLAVTEMVFRYYGLPPASSVETYQCGIASLFMRGRDATTCASACLQCEVASGTSTDLETTLQQYPRRLSAARGVATPDLVAIDRPLALSPAALLTQLNANKPVVALLTNGRPVLIVGYRSGPELFVLLNDPEPESDKFYADAGAQPGPTAGGWWLAYSALRTTLGWSRTITVAAASGLDANAPSATLQQPAQQPQQPGTPPQSVATASAAAQRCCVQSALGPSSCPSIGGPYALGTQCACQIGSMSPLLSGQICAGR
jgi:hypothetical protein